AEQRAQVPAGLLPAPPVVTHLGPKEGTELSRADPGSEIVSRVEAGVHVREEVLRRIGDAGRVGPALRVAVRRAAVIGEAGPEGELVAELRGVAAEEERLEEGGRLGVQLSLVVREAEVLGVPRRLARDGLDDVRVDLRQRVVAGELAEGVGQRRVAAGVVERVAGLVQEGLVVVQAALSTRDEVDDRGRVRGDHARARRLLRPVLEVEPDATLLVELEPQPAEGLEADRYRAFLRVGGLERREATQPRRVRRGRDGVPIRPEEALEPAL